MVQFAETSVNYADGQINVNKPPDSVFINGFMPETPVTRGMPLPAQWQNWLFRTIFRYFNRDKVTINTGLSLFPYAQSMIRLEAIDMDNVNNYLVAIGYKGAAGTLHELKVVSSNTLTLGTPTINGDQPVIGGTNVRLVAYNRQIGDL